VSELDPNTFFPTWKLRLTLRLEEFDSGVLKDRVPPKATKTLDGIKDDGASLEAVRDPENPGRFIVRTKQQAQTSKTPVVAPTSSSDGLTHVIYGIVPKTFDLRRNGIRTPDEFKAELRYLDFPFDPRCIRSCAVQFYLGTVSMVEFAQGQRGLTRGDVFGPSADAASQPMDMVSDTYTDARGTQRSNLRFEGWVETWNMTWSDDEPMIELECRDNTQLLQNQLAPAKLVIAGSKPLDEAIATYLSNFPQCAGLTVQYIGEDGEDIPVLDKVLAGTAFKPDLGPSPKKGSGDDDDLMVWDYITDVCGAIGRVAYMDGNAITVSRPSTILGGVAATRPNDVYTTRKTPEGTFPARALIFGKNIQSLKFQRGFAAKEAKNVELRCWSPRRKQLIAARYPEKSDRLVSVHTGDSSSENKFAIIRVRGIEDVATLKQMAKDYYTARMRTELEATIATTTFTSFGGDSTDPDLFDLQSTDPVEVLVDRAGDGTIATQATAAEKNEKWLTSLGYAPALAKAYTKTLAAAGFQRLFRVREVGISGSVEDGVKLEMKVANFIQVRAEKTADPGSPKKDQTQKPAAKVLSQPAAAPTPKGPLRFDGKPLVNLSSDSSTVVKK
jgi:hypothetical protein